MARVTDSERRAEAETILRFDETEHPATVYTASARVADKLRRAGLKPVTVYRTNGKESGWTFEMNSYGIVVKPFRQSVRLGPNRQGRGNETPDGSEGQGMEGGDDPIVPTADEDSIAL